MSSTQKSKNKPRLLPRWIQHLLTFAIIAVSLALAWALLPTDSFDTDLQKIGQGQPIAVLIHETASPNSMEAMDLINEIRYEVEPLEFIVATLGHPEGREFARQQQTETPGLLLFFDGEGQRTEVVFVQSLEDINRGIRSLL
ncbi:hypothetical protein SAMN05660443_1693 [Marinospirillum celere]|uniref:DUF4174 domain-containing protein n=1 Tax=Marinospirillum celere TaxID=1122252 RepID=A0A1I1H4Y4_9GAMM|nr:hypothetical protein [Marinospirillum celere]SFC16493.1 hypothetical protein SAMN05660443_1693 [Marinospirillum celere]